VVEDKDLAGLQGGEGAGGERRKLFVGRLRGSGEEGSFSVLCDTVVIDRTSRTLLAFSGVGGHTEVKSVKATLAVTRPLAFDFSEDVRHAQAERNTTYTHNRQATKCGYGYEVQTKGLGYRQMHVVALAKYPGFLPTKGKEAVWDYLVRNTTVPLDRRWLDTLMARMTLDKRVQEPLTYGPVSPCVITADDEYLEVVVPELVRYGVLRVEE
jgi:hypothetical protein